MVSLKNTCKSSGLNVLLIFIPFGIASAILKMSDTTIFLTNFIAIIPLAKLLGFATEELSLRTSETIGGLLNATFGNAVEVIIGIMALKSGLIDVVKASMIGSLLSNLLLVLGMCFFFGGIKYKFQTFNTTSSDTSASLLVMTIFMVVLPVAFNWEDENKTDVEERQVKFSRYISIVMLCIYGLYLVFQLKTHSIYFKTNTTNEEEEEPEESTISLSFSLILLTIVTLAISFCAEYLVDSIEGISENWNLSPSFVGLILLPIVGNAAEHVTAITVALKNKMDLAIGVALGSSMQVALMVIPFLVIVGWIINVNLSLVFTLFETICIFTSVLIVNQLINDGKSNWLEGCMLLAAYTIIAAAYWIM
ncbi:calcium/proton exchanger [Neocallimastix californiae]|uniref:Vacuolar calcium ion transporter n=1 Tax=Neocallimastix californiae TaxID=1754190 RepID=A0A1Y2B0S9_9FUNG|nr:calcium/proton exchanger [Neocallimastix californiae]|eukprot:ORY28344.1 calcium/proton exchanger [Neocallimastix californiae]